MSRLKSCSICSQPASYLCQCTPNTFFCFSHLETHFNSLVGQHIFSPLQNKILPKDLKKLKNIENLLKIELQQKTKNLLQTRTQTITPLLLQIQQTEQKFKLELKRIQKEELQKLKEIQQMLSTEELGERGQRELKLLQRGKENFIKAIKRIYLTKQTPKNPQKKTKEKKVVKSRFISDTTATKKVPSGKRIKTLTNDSSSVLSVAFSPNGEYLASGSHDMTVSL